MRLALDHQHLLCRFDERSVRGLSSCAAAFRCRNELFGNSFLFDEHCCWSICGLLHDRFIFPAAKEMLGNGLGWGPLAEDVPDPGAGCGDLDHIRVPAAGHRHHYRQFGQPVPVAGHPLLQAERTPQSLTGPIDCRSGLLPASWIVVIARNVQRVHTLSPIPAANTFRRSTKLAHRAKLPLS